MSGQNRAGEDERWLIEEQVRDLSETREALRERVRLEAEAERRAARRRQAEVDLQESWKKEYRRRRLRLLFTEVAGRAPPEVQPFLQKYLLDADPPPPEEWPPAGAVDLERLGFLKALAEDEYTDTTRLVYADWLDDRGEHEEADRQRTFPAARERLIRLAEQLAPLEAEALETGPPDDDEPGPPLRVVVSFERLVEFGHEVVRGWASYGWWERAWVEQTAHNSEFWSAWSVVTGRTPPTGVDQMGFHRSYCCPTDVSYYYGLPEEEHELPPEEDSPPAAEEPPPENGEPAE